VTRQFLQGIALIEAGLNLIVFSDLEKLPQSDLP
jgi:hypothetical protein